MKSTHFIAALGFALLAGPAFAQADKVVAKVDGIPITQKDVDLATEDLGERLKKSDLSDEDRRTYLTEYHKRWAIAVLCPIFALLGVGLGTNTNRRQQRAGGMIMCVLPIIVYWVLYIACEGLARSGGAPPQLAIWLPNFLFGSYALWALKNNWN